MKQPKRVYYLSWLCGAYIPSYEEGGHCWFCRDSDGAVIRIPDIKEATKYCNKLNGEKCND